MQPRLMRKGRLAPDIRRLLGRHAVEDVIQLTAGGSKRGQRLRP